MTVKSFVWLLLSILGIAILGMITQAWAVATLWSWFIVPQGAPAITMTTAMGISLIVALYTQTRTTTSTKTKEPSEILGELTGHVILSPLIAVGVGWIITLFI